MHEVVNSSNSSSDEENKHEFKEMVGQLKRKFHKTVLIIEKVKIVTFPAKFRCEDNCKRISDIKLNSKKS
jgi:hypothetical protein